MENDGICKKYLGIIHGIGWVHILAAFIISALVRLSNMGFTETQLFLKYWPVWIGIAVLAGLGVFWIRFRV